MLSPAQKQIIYEVCDLQISSLEGIFMRPDLGEFYDGESYEEFLESMGCDRKDFDQVTIEVLKVFKQLKTDPEEIFNLDPEESLVFKWILFNYKNLWENTYPRALENLWNKLFLINFNKLN